MNLVFSYGSLPDVINVGHQNMYPATLTTALEMGNYGPYPALVMSSAENIIQGVVMEMTDEQFLEADRYEGYETIYTRREFNVVLESGEEMTAWVYLLMGS